jgi:hypothetical protein
VRVSFGKSEVKQKLELVIHELERGECDGF